MVEWGALIIPILGTAICLAYWRDRIAWWEAIVPTAACVVFIAVARFGAERFITGDTEYWGSYATAVEYYEPWVEQYTETYTETTGTGKNARSETKTRTVTNHHPARWCILDSIDQELSCSEGVYDHLTGMWGNNQHVEIDHPRERFLSDGDKYVSTYDGKPNHFVPLTTKHKYTNRVRVSQSVFRRYKDNNAVQVYDYPEVSSYYQPAVVGAGKNLEQATSYLDIFNATRGAAKQVRLFLLVFPGGDANTGMAQESYWEGGNKNEVVVCIGVKNHKITWCYPFTWCEKDILKVKLRQEITDLDEADLLRVAQKMTTLTDRLFERKQFKEFAYVSVALPSWVVLTIYGLTLLVTIGVLLWVCLNCVGERGTRRIQRKYLRNYGRIRHR